MLSSHHGWKQRRTGLLMAGLLLLLALAPAVAKAQGADTLVMVWSAPGDDGTVGTASSYEMRMSTSPIDGSNFTSATPVSGLPAPLVSGTRQRVVVRGLTRGTTYYFALKSTDDVGNTSGLSNVVRWDWVFDTAPPAAPTGLIATQEGTGVNLTWTANGEPDLAGYTVYRAPSASGPWTAINGSMVVTNGYLDNAVPNGSTVLWYRVSASDGSGNESARSAMVSVDLTGSGSALADWNLSTGYPNPSRTSDPVNFPIVIPTSGAGSAELQIVDSGRRVVRQISLSGLSSGTQTVVWDGRNHAGLPVAPGVYTVWVIAGDRKASTKLVRVP
jgi:hypothetical protein